MLYGASTADHVGGGHSCPEAVLKTGQRVASVDVSASQKTCETMVELGENRKRSSRRGREGDNPLSEIASDIQEEGDLQARYEGMCQS